MKGAARAQGGQGAAGVAGAQDATPDPAAPERAWQFDEEAQARLSVIQELTVVALDLFDPKRSPDDFVDRVAERLGCYATLLFEVRPGGAVSLMSAAGLSHDSSKVPIPPEASREIAQNRTVYELPYPELLRPGLARWCFPIAGCEPGHMSWSLLLYFDGEPQATKLRGVAVRLAGILKTVLAHRNLFACTIDSERRLDEHKTMLECVADVSMDGILVIDGEGRVAFHNSRLLGMLGLEGPIETRSSSDIMEEVARRVEDPEAFLAQSRHVLESADARALDEIRLRDGRVFARYSAPVVGVRGTWYGRGIYFRDVTERKLAEADREHLLATERAARGAAEDALRGRDEFLSIASHELRTPLTSMQLVVQSALRTARSGHAPSSAPSSPTRALECVDRQIHRLNKLIDALLDVSRIQAGRLKLELERTDLVALTREVISRFGEEISRSGSIMTLSAEEPIVGTFDRSRVDQIITNLITNAIKYGQGKPIEVSLDTSRDEARLVVRDHGLGIAKEHISHMFQRFERSASVRQYGGLGLGLYIVRQIAELHGGSVGVESQLGTGSTFTVKLPLQGPPTGAITTWRR
jgi:signal transduction histidine kinase